MRRRTGFRRGYVAEGTQEYTDSKEALNAVFKELRKKGYIAKQNHLCCMTCASYDIWSKIEEKYHSKGQFNKVKGIVFYHRQATESMKETGIVMLGYGSQETSKYDEEYFKKHGIETPNLRTIGNVIVACLRRFGLQVEWSGDTSKCIEVDLTPNSRREYEEREEQWRKQKEEQERQWRKEMEEQARERKREQAFEEVAQVVTEQKTEDEIVVYNVG